ncbi:MAG TPA: M28 family peptidase [Fimbriimonadaceae bacterium]|nr:M28 family peptidase [Fimbriimonadaceae bacterium]HRJ32884.1 M28 family peptidase [Fimbriimonadaceae bacterium]
MPLLTTLSAALALNTRTPEITRIELERTLRFLCQPAWEGRLTLAPGERKTAEFLIEELKQIGLKPGNGSSYIHEFDITVNQRPTANNALRLRLADGREVRLELGKDFTPVVGTKPMSLVSAPIVFVGYGLNQEGWNDYDKVNVKDKFVLAFRGVPQGKPNVTNGAKAQWAKQAGARGILFIGPVAEGRQELPVPTRGQGIPTGLELVVAGLHRDWFDDLTGMSYVQARAMAAPASQELKAEARLVTEMEPNRGRGLNVIGILPGNDPKLREEVIVIGAHYDHLGFGEVGSRTGNELIHPGADDNATGVAGVLALAEHFKMTGSNRRTMVFQLYSGEEVGLVGAAAWVRDNANWIQRTSAMINMDMIGRLRDENLTAFCTSSSTEWDAILDGIKVQGVRINKVPAVASNSDHAPFARAQVPVVFFHTGLTPEYHTENDTIETINFDGMLRVLDVARQTIEAVDRRDTRMSWNPQASFGQRGGQARRVRVGFMPDMGNTTGPGVLLQGTTPGSPAEKAGLKAGDRVLQIGTREIKSMDDLQAALAEARPGQKLTVIVLRGQERMTVEITPEASPAGN